MAGAPSHVFNTVLQYDVLLDPFVQAQINSRPDRTPVDNMNTLFADSLVVLDVRANYDLNEYLSIHGEVRNIADKTYASSILIVDQARPDQAAFLPDNGRAFYIGLTSRF